MLNGTGLRPVGLFTSDGLPSKYLLSSDLPLFSDCCCNKNAHQDSQVRISIIFHICFSSTVTFDHMGFCDILFLGNPYCEIISTDVKYLIWQSGHFGQASAFRINMSMNRYQLQMFLCCVLAFADGISHIKLLI